MRIAAVVLALAAGVAVFAYEFRYDNILAAGGFLIRVQRFTGEACYVPLTVGHDPAAMTRIMVIPKC